VHGPHALHAPPSDHVQSLVPRRPRPHLVEPSPHRPSLPSKSQATPYLLGPPPSSLRLLTPPVQRGGATTLSPPRRQAHCLCRPHSKSPKTCPRLGWPRTARSAPGRTAKRLPVRTQSIARATAATRMLVPVTPHARKRRKLADPTTLRPAPPRSSLPKSPSHARGRGLSSGQLGCSGLLPLPRPEVRIGWEPFDERSPDPSGHRR
jgi:hypothetical protein